MHLEIEGQADFLLFISFLPCCGISAHPNLEYISLCNILLEGGKCYLPKSAYRELTWGEVKNFKAFRFPVVQVGPYSGSWTFLKMPLEISF